MSLNVDTMRTIDRWFGVPLCALITPFVLFSDWIKTKFCDEVKNPQKLLFIELSEMGSAIIVDPAMREARSQGAELYFLIFKNNSVSLTLLNTVQPGNIFTLDSSSIFTLFRDVIKFLIKVRSVRIDTVIDLELFSRATALLTGMSGAQRRVGYHNFHGEGLWRGAMLTHKVLYNNHIHIAKNFLSLVHAAFSREQEMPFSKVNFADSEIVIAKAIIDEEVKGRVLNKILNITRSTNINFILHQQPLFLVNPNASELLVQRRWSQEQFALLIVALEKKWPDCLILITGSPAEFNYVENVRKLAGINRALNFAGQVSFAELPALYDLSDVMVTNDSGPGHFSSVTDLHTVVLFGPETPLLYGSLGNSIAVTANLACSPCVSAANHRKTPCKDNVCMKAITVEQVLTSMVAQYEAAVLDKSNRH